MKIEIHMILVLYFYIILWTKNLQFFLISMSYDISHFKHSCFLSRLAIMLHIDLRPGQAVKIENAPV